MLSMVSPFHFVIYGWSRRAIVEPYQVAHKRVFDIKNSAMINSVGSRSAAAGYVGAAIVTHMARGGRS